MSRKDYLSDVSDDKWAFVAPYLTLMREDAPQREYPLREVFNGLRYIVRIGIQQVPAFPSHCLMLVWRRHLVWRGG